MKKLNTVEILTLDMYKRDDRISDEVECITDAEINSKIDAVSDIDEIDFAGRTLLTNAVLTGRAEVARYLLEKGADINIPDRRKYTALHFAASKGNFEMIQLLIQYGAAVNAKTVSGDTPLMLCSKSAPNDVFKLFMKHGADPYIKNRLGISAFDIFKSNYYIIELLSNL